MKAFNCVVPALITTLVACGGPAAKPAEPVTATAAVAKRGVSHVTGTVAKGAVVSLQPAAGESPLPVGPAVMDQFSKRFEPAVLYARVGQPVEFRNSEDMPHNVTVVRRGPGTTVFNVGTEPQQKHVHTFNRAGQYDVLCDMHPGMEATLVVATSAMATVSDEGGAFSFADVPFGDYKLSVTFEGRTVEQALKVTEPRTTVRLTP